MIYVLCILIVIIFIWLTIITFKAKTNEKSDDISVNLRIFSIIITIFIAIVGGFGFFGIQGVLDSKKYVDKTSENMEKILNIKKEVEKTSQTIQDQYLTRLKEVDTKNNELKREIEQTINKVHNLMAVYIVSDIQDKDIAKPLYFKDMKTVKNEKLPDFKQPPKIIINYTIGSSEVEIEKITEKYIKLRKSPILTLDAVVPAKYDLWIAEY